MGFYTIHNAAIDAGESRPAETPVRKTNALVSCAAIGTVERLADSRRDNWNAQKVARPIGPSSVVGFHFALIFQQSQ